MQGDELREEILSWVDESDEELLQSIGRRLIEQEPIGFAGNGFVTPISPIEAARGWMNENVSGIVEKFYNISEENEVSLALYLIYMSLLPECEAPREPISLYVARRIIEKRSAQNKMARTEGVTNERSDPVSKESKLDSAKLAPIFEDELNRAAMARALDAVMAKDGLSERQAAAKSGVNKNDVTRARNGSASIEKTSQILTGLGYPPRLLIQR